MPLYLDIQLTHYCISTLLKISISRRPGNCNMCSCMGPYHVGSPIKADCISHFHNLHSHLEFCLHSQFRTLHRQCTKIYFCIGPRYVLNWPCLYCMHINFSYSDKGVNLAYVTIPDIYREKLKKKKCFQKIIWVV